MNGGPDEIDKALAQLRQGTPSDPIEDALAKMRATPKGEGIVTAKPVIPVTSLLTPEEMGDLAAGKGGLKRQIQADIELMRQAPGGNYRVTQAARKAQAPSTAQTAADIAMSNLIAPISPASAEAATEKALQKYTEWGGKDAAANANLFGTAAALSAAGSQLGLGAAMGGPKAVPGALRGALVHGGIGGTQMGAQEFLAAKLEGEDNKTAAKRALEALAQGGAISALTGGLGGLEGNAGPAIPTSMEQVRQLPEQLRTWGQQELQSFRAPTPEATTLTPPGLDLRGATNIGATAFERNPLGYEIGRRRELRAAEQTAADTKRLAGEMGWKEELAKTQAEREQGELLSSGLNQQLAAQPRLLGAGQYELPSQAPSTQLQSAIENWVKASREGDEAAQLSARMDLELAQLREAEATPEDIARYQNIRDQGPAARRLQRTLLQSPTRQLKAGQYELPGEVSPTEPVAPPPTETPVATPTETPVIQPTGEAREHTVKLTLKQIEANQLDDDEVLASFGIRRVGNRQYSGTWDAWKKLRNQSDDLASFGTGEYSSSHRALVRKLNTLEDRIRASQPAIEPTAETITPTARPSDAIPRGRQEPQLIRAEPHMVAERDLAQVFESLRTNDPTPHSEIANILRESANQLGPAYRDRLRMEFDALENNVKTGKLEHPTDPAELNILRQALEEPPSGGKRTLGGGVTSPESDITQQAARPTYEEAVNNLRQFVAEHPRGSRISYVNPHMAQAEALARHADLQQLQEVKQAVDDARWHEMSGGQQHWWDKANLSILNPIRFPLESGVLTDGTVLMNTDALHTTKDVAKLVHTAEHGRIPRLDMDRDPASLAAYQESVKKVIADHAQWSKEPAEVVAMEPQGETLPRAGGDAWHSALEQQPIRRHGKVKEVSPDDIRRAVLAPIDQRSKVNPVVVDADRLSLMRRMLDYDEMTIGHRPGGNGDPAKPAAVIFKKNGKVVGLQMPLSAPPETIPLAALRGQPTGRLLGGKLYDIGGATGEGLRRTAQWVAKNPAIRAPAVGAVLGGAYGAATDEEGRLRGLARGALAGSAIGMGVPLAKTLLAKTRPFALGSAGEAAQQSMLNMIDFSGQKAREAAKPVGGWRNTFRRWAQEGAEGTRPIRKLGEKSETLGQAPETSAATQLNLRLNTEDTIRRALYKSFGQHQAGVLDPITRKPQEGGYSLESVMEPLGGDFKRIQQGWAYAVAKRIVGRAERAEPGQEAAIVGGDMQKLADARTTVQALERHPEIREFAKRLDRFNEQVLTYARDSGLLTDAQFSALRNSDALYVPFKRVMTDFLHAHGDTNVSGLLKQLVNVNPAIKRIMGSERDIQNLAKTMVRSVAEMIRRADSYRVGAAVIDAVENGNFGEAGHAILTKIDANDPRVKKMTIEAEKAFREHGLDEQGAEAMGDLVDAIDEHNPVIWKWVHDVDRNGNPIQRKQYYIIHDKPLYRAFGALNSDSPSYGAVMNMLTGLRRAATVTATGINPRFALATNLLRDVPDVVTKNARIRPIDFATAFIETVKSTVGRSAVADEAARWGASNASQYQHNLNPDIVAGTLSPTSRAELVKTQAKRLLASPIEAMERVGAASDLYTRLVAYNAAKRAALQAGYTEAGASALSARTAARATVDFRSQPANAFIRQASRIVPFLGASLKAAVRYGEAMSEHPGRVAATTAITVLATTLEAMYAMKVGTRKQDVDRPASERARKLQFGHVSIPLSQEQMVVAAATRAGIAQLQKDDPDALKQFYEAVWNVLPSGVDALAQGIPPIPGLQQITEIGYNKTAFGQRPVVPRRFEETLPEEVRYETTAPTFDVMAAAGRKLGASTMNPLQAEHLTRGVFNQFTPAITAVLDPLATRIMGREANKTIAPSLAEHPLNPASAVYRASPPARTQSEAWYYQLRDQRTKAQNALRDKEKALELATNPIAKLRIMDEGRTLYAKYADVIGNENTQQWFTAVDDMMKQAKEAETQVRTLFEAGQLNNQQARQALNNIRAQRQEMLRNARANYSAISPSAPQ